MTCALIGYGSWATAVAGLITANGNELNWYIRNDEVREGLRCDGHNPKYLSELEFDRSLIRPLADVNEAVRGVKYVFISVPSAFLKTFLAPLSESLEDKVIVSAIKGIVPDECKTISEYLHDTYGISFSKICMIAGPSHAEEVSMGKLSYLTTVCSNEENASAVRSLIASRSIITSYSADLYGAEYAAVLKNIYAIAAGLSDGLGYGDNFKAMLVSKCAREMTRFIEQTYPFDRDTLEPAYLGDLLVTSYSTFSRNRRLGQIIGRGCTVNSALNEMTMVAEGYYAVDCMHKLNETHGVNMPILNLVYDILYRSAPARRKFRELAKIL
ncbi:MAG: NAD(P)-binding domain-containing protein [Bacteroidia bacterium]|nr:NAD(P)-binding domain-containing protein [Bacteroidia bacterium]